MEVAKAAQDFDNLEPHKYNYNNYNYNIIIIIWLLSQILTPAFYMHKRSVLLSVILCYICTYQLVDK